MLTIFSLIGFLFPLNSITAVPPDCATTTDPLRLIAFQHVVDQKKVTELAHAGSCVTLQAQCAHLLYCLIEPSEYSCAPISPYKTTYICHKVQNCLVLVCNGHSERKKQLVFRVLSKTDGDTDVEDLDIRTSVKTLTKLFKTEFLLPWAVFCYVTLIVSTVVIFFITLALVLIYCTSCGNKFRQRLHRKDRVPEQSLPHIEGLYRVQSIAHQVCVDDSEAWSAPPTNQPKPPSYQSVVLQPPTTETSGK
ncbi:hypothetical protein D915_007904 [Fasciola hepatica]|uniref:Uncharacterized protein n=1 Tax=Fasciola hepatica TaxID=6192 RepID=A0A4E0RYF9_FASHE|nr:hypothetical protein D915_007904 [Fasciola hepatica]